MVIDTGPLSHIREHPEIQAADLDRLEQLVHCPLRILDVGAGRGGFVLAARKRGHTAMALDVERTAASIWSRRGVPGVLGDAFAIPFVAGSFNVVRLKEIIEHVGDPRRLLEAAARVLDQDGIVLAHVPSQYSQLYPAGNFWDDYTHVRPLSRLGLRRLLEDSGLQIRSLDGYTAGRNTAERMLGRVMAVAVPHTYRVIARAG
jgi:ubiquinone/menaquinone biosynthesis C-methylase UbiE